ncbi:virulence RhuM family protein [Chlorobium sp. BLA1]|uniref:virulence RhuM family protein n=1 Tax=Candidatus Chlorobium masyuteum TaxID=2716876 RepID=UPI001423D9BC|nr:virulence RhuM family protein [Candidatus Chlorobium masyuteum]NHQ60532.1 virulence RhuM family protein [Candidatus Chlorobium masyuteum]
MKKKEVIPAGGSFLLYSTSDGNATIEVRLENETVWLSQAAMAELFQTTKQNVSLHLKNVFKEGELDEGSVVKDYLTTATDGKTYQISSYNLEAIIAVGYRVRSSRGTQFRKWATQRLNEYLVKGFTMDDDRLKSGANIGSDYFDELLERIRDIRTSEKRFYQKIRDIYKLAIDYDPKSEETLDFFQIVQNKLHFAVSGKTAPELIAERADASKANMGLTSWKGENVRKIDVTIAKNYLNSEEMERLNRIVTMYLDYAEEQATRHRQVFMLDWREKLDAFLKFNEWDILHDAGTVTREVADALALEEYERYHQYRLSKEADDEALADDHKLKAIEAKVKKRAKQ